MAKCIQLSPLKDTQMQLGCVSNILEIDDFQIVRFFVARMNRFEARLMVLSQKGNFKLLRRVIFDEKKWRL